MIHLSLAQNPAGERRALFLPFLTEAPFYDFPTLAPSTLSLHLYTSFDLPARTVGDICRSLGVVSGRKKGKKKASTVVDWTCWKAQRNFW